jgi:hypothetical protein
MNCNTVQLDHQKSMWTSASASHPINQCNAKTCAHLNIDCGEWHFLAASSMLSRVENELLRMNLVLYILRACMQLLASTEAVLYIIALTMLTMFRDSMSTVARSTPNVLPVSNVLPV